MPRIARGQRVRRVRVGETHLVHAQDDKRNAVSGHTRVWRRHLRQGETTYVDVGTRRCRHVYILRPLSQTFIQLAQK